MLCIAEGRRAAEFAICTCLVRMCALLLSKVFYWAALAGDGNLRADNIMKHGTNNILIFLDVLLSRNPFVSCHFWVSLHHMRRPIIRRGGLLMPMLMLNFRHCEICGIRCCMAPNGVLCWCR